MFLKGKGLKIFLRIYKFKFSQVFFICELESITFKLYKTFEWFIQNF